MKQLKIFKFFLLIIAALTFLDNTANAKDVRAQIMDDLAAFPRNPVALVGFYTKRLAEEPDPVSRVLWQDKIRLSLSGGIFPIRGKANFLQQMVLREAVTLVTASQAVKTDSFLDWWNPKFEFNRLSPLEKEHFFNLWAMTAGTEVVCGTHRFDVSSRYADRRGCNYNTHSGERYIYLRVNDENFLDLCNESEIKFQFLTAIKSRFLERFRETSSKITNELSAAEEASLSTVFQQLCVLRFWQEVHQSYQKNRQSFNRGLLDSYFRTNPMVEVIELVRRKSRRGETLSYSEEYDIKGQFSFLSPPYKEEAARLLLPPTYSDQLLPLFKFIGSDRDLDPTFKTYFTKFVWLLLESYLKDHYKDFATVQSFIRTCEDAGTDSILLETIAASHSLDEQAIANIVGAILNYYFQERATLPPTVRGILGLWEKKNWLLILFHLFKDTPVQKEALIQYFGEEIFAKIRRQYNEREGKVERAERVAGSEPATVNSYLLSVLFELSENGGHPTRYKQLISQLLSIILSEHFLDQNVLTMNMSKMVVNPATEFFGGANFRGDQKGLASSLWDAAFTILTQRPVALAIQGTPIDDPLLGFVRRLSSTKLPSFSFSPVGLDVKSTAAALPKLFRELRLPDTLQTLSLEGLNDDAVYNISRQVAVLPPGLSCLALQNGTVTESAFISLISNNHRKLTKLKKFDTQGNFLSVKGGASLLNYLKLLSDLEGTIQLNDLVLSIEEPNDDNSEILLAALKDQRPTLKVGLYVESDLFFDRNKFFQDVGNTNPNVTVVFQDEPDMKRLASAIQH